MVTGSVPRVVVAGTSSGVGKTTVATGLMAALAARGLAVAAFKVGPDFIDPSYHALATGRPARNLDAFLSGPDLVAPLFAHGVAGADVAVVEGVMGLFDGASGRGELASTAQVAKLLDAPVLLVVDAGAMARSVAAMVHGYATFDPGLRVAGVVCNRVGSPRHTQLLHEALEPLGVPLLGTLPRSDALRTPSRHLGLVPVAERPGDAREAVRGLGVRVAAALDLEAVLALARSAPAVPALPWAPPELDRTRAPAATRRPAATGAPAATGRRTATGTPAAAGRPTAAGAPAAGRPAAGAPAAAGPPLRGSPGPAGPGGRAHRVAVAGGPAFSFVYTENLELLAAAGAELLPLDPTRDEALPEGTQALYLGGGFPEAYAEALSANAPLRRAVAGFGGPVLAECGGLLYLCRELDGLPMCGVLPAGAAMTDRLVLGYREAEAATGSALWARGERARGHEFHYSAVTPGAGPAPAWQLGRPEGFVAGRVHASYLHTHWAATPQVARRFLEVAA
ncbi:MAG TPA: cobyrinate a,c-diamide synthase [Actinomycetes bacterium]|nr:cobyrinate a,c-diamide synthase [Actinomycetes bacterium]